MPSSGTTTLVQSGAVWGQGLSSDNTCQLGRSSCPRPLVRRSLAGGGEASWE